MTGVIWCEELFLLRKISSSFLLLDDWSSLCSLVSYPWCYAAQYGPNMFACDVCGKVYVSTWNLKRHMMKVHKGSEDPEEEDMAEESVDVHLDNEECEVPPMISKLVEESREFYEGFVSNRKKTYENDGLTPKHIEIEVWLFLHGYTWCGILLA